MATACAQSTSTLTLKRKRTQISCAELEDDRYDSAYESGVDVEMREPVDQLPDGDSVYGSHKKQTKKNKHKNNKKTRFTRPRTSKHDKSFLFMSLPAELRDYIYELALTDEDGLALVSKTKGFRRTITRGIIYEDEVRYRYNNRQLPVDEGDATPTYNPLSPSLLAVSKQINSEAISYLYKQQLVFEDTISLHTFLTAIGPSNRLQLTNVTVKAWGNGRGTHKAMNVAALSMLAGCTNLQSLNLDCNIGWTRTPIQLARQIYRDGHYFLEAYGTANGRMDAAIEVLRLSEWNYNRDNYYSWRRSSSSLPGPDEFKKQFQAELRKLLSKYTKGVGLQLRRKGYTRCRT